MKQKIILKILLLIILIQTLMPIRVGAFTENKALISIPAEMNYRESEDYVSETTGLDTVTGIILEPTVEFFSIIIDSIMQIFTMFMTQNEFKFVMVNVVGQIHEMGEAGATYTIESMDPYKNAFGILDVKYPNFTYSPEEIFTGKLDLLDINFIDDSNQDEGWIKIRNVVSTWYKVLRYVAIIGLMAVLIYTGIKIIISSNSKDKAKYKERILNWFVAVILLFTMHYMMAFILIAIEEITGLLGGLNGVIEVTAGDAVFKTNLIGLARFQMQQQHFSAKIGYMIIYVALVTYTFKFTVIYFKRVLKMAFLTVIAPIVALTYPIDKMDGKASGFNMWVKEYIYNALLQPMHYILYYVLVSSSLTLAARNPIYAIAAIMFISQAEKILKKIFGFDRAKGGTVDGLAGAYTTGAIASAVTNLVKNPLHPFGGGKGKSNGKNKDNDEEESIPKPTNYDWVVYFGQEGDNKVRNNQVLSLNEAELEQNEQANEDLSGISKLIYSYRRNLEGYSLEELGWTENNDKYFENIFKEIIEAQELYSKDSKYIEQLKSMLKYEALASELEFLENEYPLQYFDRDSRSSDEIIDDIFNRFFGDMQVSDTEKSLQVQNSKEDLETLKRRISENKYINNHGGVQQILSQARAQVLNSSGIESDNQDEYVYNRQDISRERNLRERHLERADDSEHGILNTSVARGVTNVAKTIMKPAWDVEKSTSYNAKRLVGKVVKGVAGASVGIAAASVQAGISITDGKYNPLEGVATIGASMVGVSKITAPKHAREYTYEDDSHNEKEMKKYAENWFNRDDIIDKYNREFPSKGKEMRRRAVNNYITRGITDFNDQKQAIKYAEKLKSEKGMTEDEADRIAVATLQYKQTMLRDGSYEALYDLDKRKSYLDTKVETYKGSASNAQVRKVHSDLILNVLDFDKANE